MLQKDGKASGTARLASCVFQSQDGIDQPDMREGLGEIAQSLAGIGIDLLAEQSDIVRE